MENKKLLWGAPVLLTGLLMGCLTEDSGDDATEAVSSSLSSSSVSSQGGQSSAMSSVGMSSSVSDSALSSSGSLSSMGGNSSGALSSSNGVSSSSVLQSPLTLDSVFHQSGLMQNLGDTMSYHKNIVIYSTGHNPANTYKAVLKGKYTSNEVLLPSDSIVRLDLGPGKLPWFAYYFSNPNSRFTITPDIYTVRIQDVQNNKTVLPLSTGKTLEVIDSKGPGFVTTIAFENNAYQKIDTLKLDSGFQMRPTPVIPNSYTGGLGKVYFFNATTGALQDSLSCNGANGSSANGGYTFIYQVKTPLASNPTFSLNSGKYRVRWGNRGATGDLSVPADIYLERP